MFFRSDDDLFQSSTMSFGEHLEELRICLVRAVIGLLIGTVIGFFVSKHVVNFIESPVLRALKRHMVQSAKDELTLKYGTEVKDDLLKVLDTNVLIVEEVYLERAELARVNTQSQGAGVPVPAVPVPGVPETVAPSNPQAPSGGQSPAASAGTTESGALAIADLPPPTTDFVKIRLWREAQAKIQALDPWETFMIYMKASLVVGMVLASPYIFYQIWTFVAAGLYFHERKYVYIYFPLSLLLFLSGASLAFAFVFDPVLDFLFGYNRDMNIAPEMRISSIISFVLLLPLGFGISFQLPLVMFFLARSGIVPYETFIKQWRIAILVIFVIGMVLTPSGDPMSMLMLAIPLVGLYFLGLAMIRWMPGAKNPFE